MNLYKLGKEHQSQRTLTVRGSITIWLVSSLTGLDSVLSLLPNLWSNIIQLNWRTAIQRSFPLAWWVFADRVISDISTISAVARRRTRRCSTWNLRRIWSRNRFPSSSRRTRSFVRRSPDLKTITQSFSSSPRRTTLTWSRETFRSPEYKQGNHKLDRFLVHGILYRTFKRPSLAVVNEISLTIIDV